MSYQDDHNLQSTNASISSADSRRQHLSLSSAIDAFISSTVEMDGQSITGREIFNRALLLSRGDEGSEEVRELLAHLESLDPTAAEGGVSDEFLESLERVDVSSLPANADCAICTNKFVDNEYPLLVKLPCHVQVSSKKAHVFDMDCIAPWLKMHPTCPMCRFNVNEAEKIRLQKLQEELGSSDDEAEEGWDVYG